MKKRKEKFFLVLKYVKAASVNDALVKEKHVEAVGVIQQQKAITELAEAYGITIDPPEWSDEEEESKIGF